MANVIKLYFIKYPELKLFIVLILDNNYYNIYEIILCF